MKNILAISIFFTLLFFSGLHAKTHYEGYEIEIGYKNGLEFSYNNIINILNEKINTVSDKVETIKDSSDQYWLKKRDFYIDCKAFYIDCIEMINSKYPIQAKEREDALKFIETTRMW